MFRWKGCKQKKRWKKWCLDLVTCFAWQQNFFCTAYPLNICLWESWECWRKYCALSPWQKQTKMMWTIIHIALLTHISHGGFRHLREVQLPMQTALLCYPILLWNLEEPRICLARRWSWKVFSSQNYPFFPLWILDHSFCNILLYFTFSYQDLKS